MFRVMLGSVEDVLVEVPAEQTGNVLAELEAAGVNWNEDKLVGMRLADTLGEDKELIADAFQTGKLPVLASITDYLIGSVLVTTVVEG